MVKKQKHSQNLRAPRCYGTDLSTCCSCFLSQGVVSQTTRLWVTFAVMLLWDLVSCGKERRQCTEGKLQRVNNPKTYGPNFRSHKVRKKYSSQPCVCYLFIYLFLVNGPKSDTGGNCLAISYKCFSVFQVLLPPDLWLCLFRQGPEGSQDRNLPQGRQHSFIYFPRLFSLSRLSTLTVFLKKFLRHF